MSRRSNSIRKKVGAIRKDVRELVKSKYKGLCAYCGKRPKRIEVDHVFPIAKGYMKSSPEDLNDISNLLPSCGRCNRYKCSMGLEEFRKEIGKQVNRARSKSWNYKMAEDYGLVKEIRKPVVFFFERIDK